MSAIFVSHSSRDNVTAVVIAAWLRSEGHESFFLDFDPELGIPAGRSWEKELYQKLRSCRAVIVLCSRHSMASRWCFAEVAQARALGKVLLPVRIDDCAIDGLLDNQQITDLTTDKEAGFERLRRGLLAAGVDPSDVFEWDGRRAPYPGLLSFTEQDAALFFGRKEEIGAALDLLNRVRRLGSAAIVTVVGPSGSGKSSLTRAGLVPRLRKDSERWFVVDPFRPGRDPVAELAAVWAEAFRRVGAVRELDAIAGEIRSFVDDPRGASPLVAMAVEIRRTARQSEARVLVVVDQFEELLDPTSSDAAGVLNLLRSAAEGPHSPLLVLATLRSDFTGAFQQHPALRGLRGEFVSLGPMSTGELAKVIEGPAAIVGLELESGLVQAMLADVETDDALPLLAFTLRELLDRYGDDGRIDVREYRDLGGLHGALAKVADELIESQQLSDDQQEQLRRAFLRMVRLTDDDRWVRRVVRWDEHPEAIHPILQQFVTARLLVSGGGADGATVEVAHEAMFRSWGRLAGWLRDDADALRLRRDLDYSSKSWTTSGRNDADLWRGDRLERAEKLVEREDVTLEAEDREFIDASKRAAQAELDRLERSRRRRLRIAGGVTLGAVVLLGVAGWTFHRAGDADQRAHNETRKSDALTLSAESLNVAPENPAIALALAVEAFKTTSPALPRAQAALFEARRNFGTRLAQQIGEPLTGHDDAVRQVTFSPDGTMLASVSDDGSIRLWDATTRAPTIEPLRHDEPVYGVAFSPDGGSVVSASRDGTVTLWDARTGEQLRVLSGHIGGAWGVAFNPDGDLLATSDNVGTVRVWDPATGVLRSKVDHGSRVRQVAFSPDGELLASAGDDGTIRLWDSATGDPTRQPLDNGSPVYALAFRPDGRLASGGADGVIRLWDPETGEVEAATVDGHEAAVLAVAFNEKGDALASGGRDRTIRLWDAETLSPLGQPLRGHQDWVGGLAFGGSPERLASGSADKTVRLWDLTRGTPIGQLLAGGPRDDVRATVFSPGGALLVTASSDGTARVWDADATTQEPRFILDDGETPVHAAAFSRDGRFVATAGQSGVIRLWDTATGEPAGELTGHDGDVFDLAFSPDEDLLASAGRDGIVRLWDPITRAAVGQLPPQTNWIRSVAFSHDGDLLATGGRDGTIRLWDPATGEAVGDPLAHLDDVFDVTFSPVDDLLASASADGVVRLWNPVTRTASGASLSGHLNAVYEVAFNSDGSLLATAGEDRTMRLWDEETRRPVGIPIEHEDLVYSVGFNPRQPLLASGDAKGDVQLWNVWDVDVACRLAARYVKREQLDVYLPNGTESPYCPLE